MLKVDDMYVKIMMTVLMSFDLIFRSAVSTSDVRRADHSRKKKIFVCKDNGDWTSAQARSCCKSV